MSGDPAAAGEQLAELAGLAESLRDTLRRLDDPATAVVLASLSRQAAALVATLRDPAPVSPGTGDALTAAVRHWLAAADVSDHGLAADLAGLGLAPASLDALAAELDADSLARVLAWLPARVRADRDCARLAAGLRRLAAGAPPPRRR